MSIDTTDHIKWPKIRSPEDVFAQARRDGVASIAFYRTVKLHGTNAAVRITPDGRLVAQSRTRDITPGDDNHGFAAWVAANEGRLRDWYFRGRVRVVYGEWVGPGIQSGDAVCHIPERTFVPFSVLLEDGGFCPTIHAPTVGCDFEGDLEVSLAGGPLSDMRFAADARECAEAIGARDPYVARVFGIEGPGEGLVFAPDLVRYANGRTVQSTEPGAWSVMRDYYIKVKAARHTEKRPRAPRAVSAPSVEAVDFVERWVTYRRVEKAVTEAADGSWARERTGDVLKWVNTDVKDEGSSELEALGLVWKDVAKGVNERAKLLFFAGPTP